MPIFQKQSHGGAMYTQKQHLCGGTVRVDSPHATSDSAVHWGNCNDRHLICILHLIRSQKLQCKNIPDDCKHEAFYARNAEMVVGLFCFILQYVLHDKNHILDEHCVSIAYNCLPTQNASTLISNELDKKLFHNMQTSFHKKTCYNQAHVSS